MLKKENIVKILSNLSIPLLGREHLHCSTCGNMLENSNLESLPSYCLETKEKLLKIQFLSKRKKITTVVAYGVRDVSDTVKQKYPGGRWKIIGGCSSGKKTELKCHPTLNFEVPTLLLFL